MREPSLMQRQINQVERQHIGWLKIYIAEMNEDNWRDMRLRAERQLAELSDIVNKGP